MTNSKHNQSAETPEVISKQQFASYSGSEIHQQYLRPVLTLQCQTQARRQSISLSELFHCTKQLPASAFCQYRVNSLLKGQLIRSRSDLYDVNSTFMLTSRHRMSATKDICKYNLLDERVSFQTGSLKRRSLVDQSQSQQVF